MMAVASGLTLDLEVGPGRGQALGVGGHPGAVGHAALPDAEGVTEAVAGDDQPVVLVHPLPVQAPCQSGVLGRHHALEGGVLALAHRDVVELGDELHRTRG